MRDVGRRVAELRAAHRVTQEAFAERAEVSVGYVRQVEAGRENLTLSSLAKLAGLLGVEAGDLLVPPTSREAKRGRPRRQAQVAPAASPPPGPTVLDVQHILGTEEELDKLLDLAIRSAAAPQQAGDERVAKVRAVLEAVLRETSVPDAPAASGGAPTSSATSPRVGEKSARRARTGRKSAGTKRRR